MRARGPFLAERRYSLDVHPLKYNKECGLIANFSTPYGSPSQRVMKMKWIGEVTV